MEKGEGLSLAFFISEPEGKRTAGRLILPMEDVRIFPSEALANSAGLPGKKISFKLCPFNPAHKAGLAGHIPAVKERQKMWGFFDKLKKGLSKTHQGFVEKIDRLFLGKKTIDEDLLDELEALLFEADFGVKTTEELIEGVRQGLKRGELQDPEKVKEFIKQKITQILQTGEKPLLIDSKTKPFVLMIVGVNGGGKTTTIGKMANQFASQGKKVLIGAADTFRAAAVEQLEVWAKRVGADLIKQSSGSDPSAVAFDSIRAAKSRGADLVFIDTAGRLHTKVNLMEELKKIKRIISRECPGAPHEVLLVLDSTTGQNAISQAKLFNDAIGVTGIALTKLDGTAKGGIIIGITEELKIPIRYIGVGEGIDDLKEFNADEFVRALF
jgi:fused signal recognition particle receptor